MTALPKCESLVVIVLVLARGESRHCIILDGHSQEKKAVRDFNDSPGV